MGRLCADLTRLLPDLPYADRFDEAAEAGFDAVELACPYDVPAAETRNAVWTNGLTLVRIGAPPPNYTGGDPGYAAQPGGARRFQHDLRRTLRYAGELGVGVIHLRTGPDDSAQADEALRDNLRWLAELAPDMQFTVPPLGPCQDPEERAAGLDRTANILSQIETEAIGLEFRCDMSGQMLASWTRHAKQVRHVQMITDPDPHLDLCRVLLAQMQNDGYDGWISAAYPLSQKGRLLRPEWTRLLPATAP